MLCYRQSEKAPCLQLAISIKYCNPIRPICHPLLPGETTLMMIAKTT